MATPLDLSQTVTQYLTTKTVDRLFHQMGSSLDNEMMLNDYQAYVQVIAWSILDRLKASDSFLASQLTEDNVKPIVDSAIKDMCTIVPQDLEFPHCAPSYLTSRVIWWSLKLCRRELS